MKSLNKSLLTAAVAGALALPGLASAASLNWQTPPVQLTYATDLIVDDGSSVVLPDALVFAGDALDAGNLDNTPSSVPAGTLTNLEVVLSLTGAEFAQSNPTTLANTVLYGNQLGLANVGIASAGASYSGGAGGRRVLRYTITVPIATTGGNVGPGYAIQIPPFAIAHTKATLGNPGGTVILSATINRASGTGQILAASTTIARSAPGLAISSNPSPTPGKRIDVAPGGGAASRTFFSPDGVVGNSNPSVPPPPADRIFNAGGFTLDINRAPLSDGTGPVYINDIDGSVAQPAYNVVGSGRLYITVNGTDLSPWVGTGRIWVENAGSACTRTAGQFQNLIVTAGNPTQAVTAVGGISPLHGLFNGPTAGVGFTPPTPSSVSVCFQATGAMPSPDNLVPMVAQPLSGTLTVQYNLPGARVNPAPLAFNLSPLLENGTTVYLQNFNPGSNANARSILRVTNHNAVACPMRIEAKDDAGKLSGTVRTNIAAHGSQQFDSDVLENGDNSRFTGNFRKGTGKWYVRVTGECANITVSALSQNKHSGALTNLTAQSDLGGFWSTPTTNVD